MAFFDHFANPTITPIGKWIKIRSRQNIFRKLNYYIPNKNCEILEIGPGYGELATIFKKAGYSNYSVVEPNEVMREKLKSLGFDTKDYLIPYLEEENDTYHAIMLVDVFEHLNDSHEANVFMTEARRVLKMDGILCIFAPDYLHWKEDFFNGDYSHNNITTVRRELQLLYNHGFGLLMIGYFSGFFTGEFATLISLIIRLVLFFPRGNAIDSKIYKLKLTFLRQFLIVGVKE